MRAALALALLLTGCAAVGPDYEAPDLDAPGAFGGPPPAEDGVALAAWWDAYDDDALTGLIRRGLDRSLDLQLAESRLREARAELRRTLAGREPTVSVGGGGTTRAEQASTGGGLSTGGSANARLDASWEADLFGGIRREIEAAEAGVGAALWRLRDVRVALAAEIALNYIELRGAERRLAITRELLDTQEATLRLVGQRAEVGLATGLDVARSSSSVDSLRAQIPRIQSEIQAARNRLAVLLGLPPGTLDDELAPPAPVPAVVRGADLGLPVDLIRRRPDLRVAERELAAASARIGVAEAQLYPRLTLPGSLVFTASGIGTGSIVGSVVATLAATLSHTLADGGARTAAVEAAEERAEQALLGYRRALLLALEDVERALIDYAEARERHAALGRVVAADERAFELARQLYQEGVTSFLDLLDAQRSLTSSRQELVVTEAALSTRLATLYKALGGGWEEARHGIEKGISSFRS
jgi:outer membrane protein, multidrug efflux system